MADNYGAIADLLPSLSPLEDPDAARQDPKAAIAGLLGDPTPKSWAEQAQEAAETQQDAPAEQEQSAAPPQRSPNGNALPAGLQSREPQPAAATQAVPAGVTPSGDATTQQPDLAGGNAKTIALMQGDYARASQDVQNEAAQPSLADQTKVLEQQRVNAQARQVELQNPNDPKTGKLRDEYKPSFGQRLVRGVDGFARAGVFGVVDPALKGGTAYGAPNKQYGYDQTQAAGRVAGADQQLTNAAANYKATSERLQKIAADRRALATTGKDVTGASIAQQEIPIKQQDSDTKQTEAENSTPEAKQRVAQNQYDQRVKNADAQKLKGANRTYYLANGKIPDPQRATAEEIALSQATAAWHRDHPGQQPGLEDVRTISAASRGSEIRGQVAGKPFPPALAARISEKKASDMKAAQDKLAKGIDVKNNNMPYKKSDFVREMNEAQNGYEEAIEAAGGTVNHMKMNDDTTWTAQDPTPSPSKPSSSGLPPPTPQTHPVGSTIMVNGKPRIITSYNPKTHKPVVAPE